MDLARIRNGDTDAFGRFLSEHYDMIFRTAWRWCGNQTDAEDIAQNVCVKLASALSSFDGRSSISTWLHRIVINTVHDLHRSNRKHKHHDTVDENHIPSLANQENALQSKQILSAIRMLPERQRDAVLLVHAEGLSHAEAGAVMGCSENTVSYHIHTARKALRAML